jgi:hypothetical protein
LPLPTSATYALNAYATCDLLLGAALKKTKLLGFGGPGLKIHVLKEHSCPAPVLEGVGRIYIYNIFGVRAF